MPTTRKRIARGLKTAGGIQEVDFLYYTFGPFFEAEEYANGKSEEELKRFYRKYVGVILDRYFKENREKCEKNPGMRPWSFWKYDSRIEGKVRLPVPPEERLGPDGLHDWRKADAEGFEGDYNFLKRLGLLEPWELEG